MSSETKGQLCIFTCDSCGEEREIAGSFKDAWESLKEEGWRCWNNSEDPSEDSWEHRCNECCGR